MPDIVTCTCGVKVRVPASAGGRAFRCPKCKAELLVTANGHGGGLAIASTPAGVTAVGTVCPICQTGVAVGEAVVACPGCDQTHHRECWGEVGGCGTYGCKHAPAPSKDGPPADEARAGWGDTKSCPACGETIKSVALRCRFCGMDFDTVDPMTVRDLAARSEREESMGKMRSSVVALFIFSVVGLFAPLMTLISIPWVLYNRPKLAKAGPLYVVMAYASMALSVVYTLLMLLFWLFERP